VIGLSHQQAGTASDGDAAALVAAAVLGPPAPDAHAPEVGSSAHEPSKLG